MSQAAIQPPDDSPPHEPDVPRRWFEKIAYKLREWVLWFLQQGLTPEELALSMSLGVVLGVFPALGTTSLLCLVAATVGRLNQPAMQSVSFVAYPLQFLLLIPFYKMGAALFHDNDVKWTAKAVWHLIGSGVLHAVDELWITTWHAIAVWALIAPFAVGLIYLVLSRLFRRYFKAYLSFK